MSIVLVMLSDVQTGQIHKSLKIKKDGIFAMDKGWGDSDTSETHRLLPVLFSRISKEKKNS